MPTIRELLKRLEIDEAEFIKRCNVSFKLGVRFVDWDINTVNGHGFYDHPFDGVDADLQGMNPGYHYHKFGAIRGGGSFSD